jgi:hypothetical protein
MPDDLPNQLVPSPRPPGKRGQGRKPGAATKLTRSLANELCRQGLDGLSLMLDNAVFWKGKANELGSLVDEQLARIKLIPGDKSNELTAALAEFNKTHATYIAVRDRLQNCGVDMAPYTNARLQAISIQKTSVHTEIKMTLAPAADDTERTYRTDGNVVTLQRSES